jgi:hypothetical protein
MHAAKAKQCPIGSMLHCASFKIIAQLCVKGCNEKYAGRKKYLVIII